MPYVGEQAVMFPSTAGTLRDPDNFNGQWRKVRAALGVPDVTSHSFRKTVATLVDDEGLSARIAADHLRYRQAVTDHRPARPEYLCSTTLNSPIRGVSRINRSSC